MMLATCDRTIAAPVDLVWSLVSTAAGLNQWMSVEATVDLRVGGAIRWEHDNGWVVAGTIREVTPMRRLSYTYGWERGGFPVPLESSVVTIELTARGDATDLAIRHEGLTPEMAEQHTGGWRMFVDRLADRAEMTGTRDTTGTMAQTDESLFWELIEELQLQDPRVEEGTIMGGRCARVAGEFLGLVDYKGSGMVVKLSKERVAELIDQGVGQPFAPATKVFKEWVSVPQRDRRRRRALIADSIAFVAPS